MAHPHRLPNAKHRIIKETRSNMVNVTATIDRRNVHTTIFLSICGGNGTSKKLNDELKAIAYTKDGDVVGYGEIEEVMGGRRGAFFMHRVRATREDDEGWREGGYGWEGGGSWEADGADAELSDATGDEVGVLGAIVEDDDHVAFVLRHSLLHLSLSLLLPLSLSLCLSVSLSL